jgi:hypothetical protein
LRSRLVIAVGAGLGIFHEVARTSTAYVTNLILWVSTFRGNGQDPRRHLDHASGGPRLS